MSFQRYRYRRLNVPSFPPNDFKEYVTDETIPLRIQKLADNTSITIRDKEFCISISSQWERSKRITKKQYEYFCVIEKRYSLETLQENEQFTKEWNDNPTLRENFRICCNYYRLYTPYYQYITDKWVRNPEYIPQPEEYEKICENKYSLRYLDSLKDAPKFNVGDLVEVCSTQFFPCVQKGIVLLNNGLPQRAVKGGKIYTIQSITTGRRIEIEEKRIRKLRIKKEKKDESR